MLHIGPVEPDEHAPAPRTQAYKWAANVRAARQFHAREGHLQPYRKAMEVVDGVEHKIGMFVDNTRRRADKLSPQRRQELTELGMRW
ncbi:helicase associated domain-containing protein [Actinacidiphila acididurans]|uniref:Helicase associated domain-containing protein n=1 Tax=Actinacidiphila acididurans TaxID=2784346 RepID=A0ABS2TTV7_9ACTN|nr:helicase associated domain-containing protein [Actinacidiphila acididurans]MBM9506778.1 helicase associated domain-containing protein [Actinacidiphila acididurans]